MKQDVLNICTSYIVLLIGKVLYDIIFLDPPFRTGLLEKAVELINDSIAPDGCLVYIEHEKENALKLPEKYHLLKSGNAGQVTYSLYEINSGSNS
ncbi:Conserved hypothetical protein 95 [Ruminobacter amylophilus]|uniref:16S rRNA (Guanine(966)-N(2))-methyltransferase RsmD n=1 Tax=Ruminobacter amylophilus TaxID=867 RepID=A0A662ZK38_9GAMM|nr:Conserved hypothetical protein 95 [Ruminobacter amylophilus]